MTYCKKIAICYSHTKKTVYSNNKVTTVTSEKSELYFLETKEESARYKHKKPLFKRFR